MIIPLLKVVLIVSILAVLNGCSSYGVIDNNPTPEPDQSSTYSLKNRLNDNHNPEITLILNFSGGGTRAAALSYGVLKALRDINIGPDKRSLINEVDIISSVSGGSFTSAYYGLYGERIFIDYEDRFLRKNIQSHLIRGLFNPFNWMSNKGRTDMASEYYEASLFGDSTFSDIKKNDGPLILINASDLESGVRFSFVQEYFNLLCSDIDSYPVAKAVTASSAVPVLFNPVVLGNYSDCKGELPDWLARAEKRAQNDFELKQTVDNLKQFYANNNTPYLHLVDGGITDNLGLRAIYEIIELSGGTKSLIRNVQSDPPRFFVIISVDASTKPDSKIGQSNKTSSIMTTLNAVSTIQLHRYNDSTINLLEHYNTSWAKGLSDVTHKVQPYFIHLSFEEIKEESKLKILNLVPTSFALTDEQVDQLIAAGQTLLLDSPEFQRLLRDLESYYSTSKDVSNKL